MRSYWSLRYLLQRLPDYFDQKTQVDVPWLNPKIREALDSLLMPGDFMVECGAGRSTLWFAKRVGNLLSIEFDRSWYQSVASLVAEAGCKNVDLRFVDYSLAGDQERNQYIDVLNDLKDASVDVCLVDGGPRSFCAQALIPKLRPGGLLVIDDVHNFVPSASKTPNAVREESQIPTLYAGHVRLNWHDVYAAIRTWRRLWLSNGVRDTAIFFKPSS